MSLLSADPVGRVVLVEGTRVRVFPRAQLTEILWERMSCYGMPMLEVRVIGADARHVLQFTTATVDDGESIYLSLVAEDGDVVWTGREVETPGIAEGMWYKNTHWTRTPDAPRDRVER